MAIGYLTLSSDKAGALSTWTGTRSGSSIVYSTPTSDGQKITVSVPAEMQGAVFNSATLVYSVSGGSGTRKVQYDGTGTTVTNVNLLSRLTDGESLDIYFSFRASGGSGGVGSHSATCEWKNIQIAVDYTPASGLTGSATVTNAGTATYYLEKPSLAYGETMTLNLTARPTRDVSQISVTLYPGSITTGFTMTATKSVAANSVASVSFTAQIDAATLAAMTQRTHNAQIKIDFVSGGTTYTSGRVLCGDTVSGQRLKLVRQRSAPVISAVTWSEDGGTTHVQDYGAPIALKTRPVIGFTVTLDTDADTGIGIDARTLEIADKTYTLSANSATIDVFASGGAIGYTISVTDSYGVTGTLTGSVTVLEYTLPTMRGAAISRYVTGLDPHGQTVYELDDDGVDVWFDAVINVQTVLGTGSNPWTLRITPDGGTTVTPVSASTVASVTYTHERSFITTTYAANAEHGFTVELSDAFSTVSLRLTIPKAGGILNIEKSGVAVGMRSSGTEQNPIFESAYPAYFRNGIYDQNGNPIGAADDSGWQALTPENSSQASGWAPCAVRRLNGVIYVRGAVTLSAVLSSSQSRKVATLPDGYRPPYNMLVNGGARNNYTCIEIDADGSVLFWNRVGSNITTSEIISISAVFCAD